VTEQIPVEDLELNDGQQKLNGCYDDKSFSHCYKRGYIRKLTYCGHPVAGETVNPSDGRPCRPCHPKAKRKGDIMWAFY
jgi:hypothetical protein